MYPAVMGGFFIFLIKHMIIPDGYHNFPVPGKVILRPL